MDAPMDDIANFQTALSELPRSMVLGPGGAVHPPSSALFDDQGILLWDLLSKSNLWGASQVLPRIESDGFLWSAHYLHRFSDLTNEYWKNLSQEDYLKRYEPAFKAFTKDLEFPKTILAVLKESLAGTPEGAMNVARITSAWIEKMLYVTIQYHRQLAAQNGEGGAKPEDAADEGQGGDRSLNDNPKSESSSESTSRASPAPNAAATDAEQLRAISFQSLKMKDMLAMPIIKEKLGVDRSYLLRLLVGPLHGLNTRNLLWHGFVAPHEWPTYLSGLLVGVLFSVALEWQDMISTDLYQRILQKFQSNLSFFDPYLLASSPVLRCPTSDQSKGDDTERLLSLCKVQRQSIVELIRRSSFALNGSRSEWVYGLDLLLGGRYYEALAVFFPLLEASLRKVYVDSNNISTFRLTAEPDTLCLSLDLVLEDWLDREILIQDRRTKRRLNGSGSIPIPKDSANPNSNVPDGQPLEEEEDDDDEEILMEADGKTVNAIFERLGQDTCGVLFDILIWADSLGLRKHYRPRDQLAHGSAMPNKVSRVNAMHLLLALLNMLQQFLAPTDDSKGADKIPSPEASIPAADDILSLARKFTAEYQPCFHKKRATIDAYWNLMEYLKTWPQKCAEVITPEAEKLLRDAIQKEKRSEDTKWDARCRRRLVELAAQKARIEAAVAGTEKLRNAKHISKDTRGQFPIKSPITLTCLIRLLHTSDLIASMRSLLENMLKRFATYRDLVVARKAWLQDRRHFAGLVEALPVFGLGVETIMLMVKEMLMHEDVPSTVEWIRSDNFNADFPTFIWTLTQRMCALDSDGKYRRCEEVLDCMLSSVPKVPEMLGKAEGFRSWLDIESYVWRLECFARGEKLEDFRVFEHERNAHVREFRRLLYGGAPIDPRTSVPLSHSQYELFLLQHSLGHLIVSPPPTATTTTTS